MRLTGIRQLDELVHPFNPSWVLELYGDPRVVLRVAHYTMAYRSVESTLHVLLNLEFGGLDTLYLVKLCRIFNCNLDNIVVSRAFRLSDTIGALEELSFKRSVVALLVFPYNYLSKNPLEYTEATRITGLISKIALSNQVLLFNTVSKFGRYRPEGGSFHHHAVKVSVKLTRRGDILVAELTRHPVRGYAVRTIHTTILEHPVRQHAEKTLLDWLVENRSRHYTQNLYEHTAIHRKHPLVQLVNNTRETSAQSTENPPLESRSRVESTVRLPLL